MIEIFRMRSSLVVRASDCQCTSCYGPGFDPSIRRTVGAADEAVLNIQYVVRIYFANGEKNLPKIDCWAQEGAPIAKTALRLEQSVYIRLYFFICFDFCSLKNPSFHLWGLHKTKCTFFAFSEGHIRAPFIAHQVPESLRRTGLHLSLSVKSRRYNMNGKFQMQGGKNWILQKQINANGFFSDSHWL